MTADLSLTPIPQPSEIIGFLIRNFSQVDDANNEAFKKSLQRLKDGKPLDVDTAMGLLETHLKPIVDAGAGKWNLLGFLREALENYVDLCRNLDCGALAAEDVRRVFDRVAGAIFAHHLRLAFKGSGVDPETVIGNPDEGLRLLWRARLKGRAQGAVAREIENACGRAVYGSTWEDNLRRWKTGRSMQTRMILELIEHWDLEFGFALLSARAYREYCKFPLVDPAMHRTENRISHDRLQSEIEALMSGEKGLACLLPPPVQQDEIDLMRLIDPRRAKLPGEAAAAEACLTRIEDALAGEPRLAGLGVLRGRYEMQMGRRQQALEAFEAAANWFAFRSAMQMKIALHHLLFIAAALGDKHRLNRWRAWAEGVGLLVDIPDPEGSLARDFPHPYPGAEGLPAGRPHAGLVALEEWKRRPADTRNPNRMIKGYGPTPTPQLGLFAHLGQAEKVRRLLDAGGDPDKFDANGGSALLMAIQGGDDTCVEFLIQASAPTTINTRTRKGKSPLHEAISARRPDWVEGLLNRGADVELRGTHGQTPLFQAVGLFTPVEQALAGLLDLPPMNRAIQKESLFS
ncbi:hypothetical protein GCM10008024_05470 [Allgaiera indica]|uniref:Ankyrin repeat-containing protein n=1 Tax=Allgaiera indica TaxID=765699 RepID=A0AAN4UP97_9RHOB|nr:ankyrin repeat domain-containing protein [Allgaiera indica]GHD99169.1 hypothetical protein GCM10008024_05470 [Allgaiera indica]SDW31938.1 Ankyrin repeat-containing protein [Allgaiera indica]